MVGGSHLSDFVVAGGRLVGAKNATARYLTDRARRGEALLLSALQNNPQTR